ncbi:MAG: S9 family peptidase [Parachlamydiaceae bacterium]
MHQKIAPTILYLMIALQNVLFSVQQEDLSQVVFFPKEIGSHEKIAVHPDGQSIAYTVYQRPLGGFPNDDYTMPTGVPFNRQHSSLYLYELKSGKVASIGPADANCWRPCFSPDGKKIAFYCDKGGASRLWIYDVGSGQSNLACKEEIRTHPLASIDCPYWDPDSSYVYIPTLPLEPHTHVNNRESKHQEPTVCLYSSEGVPSRLNIPMYGKICSAALNTGECKIILPINDNDPLSSQFVLSNSGRFVAYFSLVTAASPASLDLRVCSTAHPQKTFNIARDLTIRGMSAGIVWHPHQDKLAFVEEGRVFIASWDKGEEYEMKELSSGYKAIFSETTLKFSSDGKTLLVGTNRKKEDRSNDQDFVVFSLEETYPYQITLPKEWSYISTLETESGYFWQPEENVVMMILENGVETAIAKFYLETNAHEILWKSKLSLSGIVASRETNQVFYIGEGLNASQDIYLASPDFSMIERLTHIDPRQDALAEITTTVIESTVPRYDGTLEKVKTTVLLPKGFHSGNQLPAIVEVYPGVNLSSKAKKFGGGSVASFPSRFLLEKGYAIVLPDLRIGPEGEPGNAIKETVDRLLPQVYQAANLGVIDINRLGLIGQSFGGYGAAGVAAKTSLFRASVCISGRYDLLGEYGAFSECWEGFSDIDWFENRQGRMGGHPWENLMRYLENSPFHLAKDIKTPLLFIHGEKDSSCSVKEAQKMFTALKRLGKKVDLAIYKNEGHVIDNWSYSNAVDVVKRIIAFYDQQLLPQEKAHEETGEKGVK